MENLAPTISNSTINPFASTDDGITEEAWKAKFIEFYETNAPSKVKLVNDKMMTKYRDKYHVLMNNLIKKYGPLGKPASTDDGNGAGATLAFSSMTVSNIDDHSSKFSAMIDAATPAFQPRNKSSINVIKSKTSKSQNAGLETSTFTVCVRIRPLLQPTNNYAAVVPGQRTSSVDNVYNEELLLFTPKVSITGKVKLDTMANDFDYVFGEHSTNAEIYSEACQPIVERALNGQVGVVFAYGQTGSKKIFDVVSLFICLLYLCLISHFIFQLTNQVGRLIQSQDCWRFYPHLQSLVMLIQLPSATLRCWGGILLTVYLTLMLTTLRGEE
jgi:hypothetical protein